MDKLTHIEVWKSTSAQKNTKKHSHRGKYICLWGQHTPPVNEEEEDKWLILHVALWEACMCWCTGACTFNVVEPGVSWLLYASIAWCIILCAAICFSTSARLGPYGSASNCFYKSQHCKPVTFHSYKDLGSSKKFELKPQITCFSSRRGPQSIFGFSSKSVRLLYSSLNVAQSFAQRSCKFLTLQKQMPRSKSLSERQVESSRRECGNGIAWWHVAYQVLGVSVGMYLCLSLWGTHVHTPRTKYILSFYLSSLWVLQLLGLVHIHEEVLKEPLSLLQVVCVRLLVDHGQILFITLSVLHKTQKEHL